MSFPRRRHAPFTVMFVLLMVGFAHGFSGGQSDTCTYRKWTREGAVKLLVVAGLHENTAGRCGQWSRSAVEGVVAIDWMLAKLNGNLTNGPAYIPGVTLGYDLYDNCDNPDLTTDLLYTGTVAEQQMQCTGEAGTQETYAAILSLADIESSHVMAHMTQPTVLLRPLPTSPGLEKQTNVIQNVVSFQQEARAIVAFLSNHGWNMVIVVHTADEYGLTTSAYFSDLVRTSDVCVHLNAEPTDSTVQAIFTAMQSTINSTIAVVFFGDQRSAEDFVQLLNKYIRPHASRIIWIFSSLIDTKPAIKAEDFFFSIQYPQIDLDDFKTYFNDVYTNKTDSPLNGIETSHGSTARGSKVSHVVDSLLSVAHAVKQTGCTSGRDCNVVLMSSVNISEEFSDGFIPESYRAQDKTLQYSSDGIQEFVRLVVTDGENEVGSVNKHGEVTAHRNYPTLSSACEGVCTSCRDQKTVRYSYLDGDVLILGLFSLRTYGATPYSCGVFRGTCTDTISVSAFMEYIMSRRQAENIKYGGIALDDCYNGLNTTHILAELFSKRMVIRNPNNGVVIDFDNVVLIVGALSSPVSITVADFATSVGLPMISYAASTPELDNRNRYPYFFRTVPSDTQQVEGILKVITKVGVTHIGAIYIDDSYGRTGILKLQEEAAVQHICVEKPLAVTQGMSEKELKDIIDKLYVQQVRVVVYYSLESIAEALLRQMPGSDTNRAPLIFIASEAWGRNQNVISNDLGKKAIGTIVFNIANRIESNLAFKQYLLNLHFSERTHNRWIPKLFEDYNKCNLVTSFEKIQNVEDEVKLCGTDFKETLSNAAVDALYSDQRVVHIAHSVHAAIDGYKQFCTKYSSNDVCRSRVRSDTESFVSSIASVRHNDERLFDNYHNGNIGFTLYNIQLNETGRDYSVDYIQIGTYSTEGRLILTRQPVFYNDVQKNISLRDVDETDCIKYEGTCSPVCLLPTTTTAPVTEPTTMATEKQTDKESNTMLIITIVLAVLLAILGIALVLILVVLLRRTPKKAEPQGFSMEHRRSVDNTYARIQSESHYSMPSSTRSTGHAGGRLSKPIEYSDIRHLSYPDLRVNHVRQMSSPEVLQTTGLSTPSRKPRKSPATKKILRPKSNNVGGLHSDLTTPKTPHSAPMVTTMDRNFRYKPQSSPRFRYPSAQAESRYTYPTEQPSLSIPRVERELVRAEMHPENSEPESHIFNSYITPQAEEKDESKTEAKITYLTAKDLVQESSEDEEESADDIESADDTGYLSANPSSVNNDANNEVVLNKYAYNPNLKSPSDNEVSKINFPDSATSPKSLTEMPDVLRHGPYEEDDDTVFII